MFHGIQSHYFRNTSLNYYHYSAPLVWRSVLRNSWVCGNRGLTNSAVIFQYFTPLKSNTLRAYVHKIHFNIIILLLFFFYVFTFGYTTKHLSTIEVKLCTLLTSTWDRNVLLPKRLYLVFPSDKSFRGARSYSSRVGTETACATLL
jgi:hypothetical protein